MNVSENVAHIAMKWRIFQKKNIVEILLTIKRKSHLPFRVLKAMHFSFSFSWWFSFLLFLFIRMGFGCYLQQTVHWVVYKWEKVFSLKWFMLSNCELCKKLWLSCGWELRAWEWCRYIFTLKVNWNFLDFIEVFNWIKSTGLHRIQLICNTVYKDLWFVDILFLVFFCTHAWNMFIEETHQANPSCER